MSHPYRSPRALFSRRSFSAVLFALWLPAFLFLASLPAQGQTFSILYYFTGLGDGGAPEAGVIMDGAGNLFGTNSGGGSIFDGGTIFELKCTSYNPTTRSCETYSSTDSVLFTFTGVPGGFMPEAGLTIDGAGNLFGTTTYGGATNNGTIFELPCASYDSTAHSCESYSRVTVLSSITWLANNVEMPYSGLILDGAGNLFGTTATDGTSDNGAVIELACISYNSATASCETYNSTISVLYSFAGSGGDGAEPFGGLVLDGTGNLFGTTIGGGARGGGAVFELACSSYNSTSHSCAIYSSTDSVLGSFAGGNGEAPYAGLILDAAGNLFGTTAYGGATGYGTVFELPCDDYNAATRSCATYSSADTVLYSFTDFEGDGANPAAAVTLDSAGNLFGTTLYGGVAEDGTVFELACASYNASAQACTEYSSMDTALASIGGVVNGYITGQYPYATPILDGAGNLFGTILGYFENQGTIFEVSGAGVGSSTGGSNKIAQTIAFPNPGTQTAGVAAVPLTATASSGLTVTYTSNSTSVCTVSGDTATMIAVGTCSITASQAGNSSFAAARSVTDLFSVNVAQSAQGEAFITLYSFTATGDDGATPYSGLIMDGAGNLFGTTFGGNASGGGTIFELACTSYSVTAGSCEKYGATDTVLHDFTWSGGDGVGPYAGLIMDGAGNLFGTTTSGGATGNGTVFELACTSYNVSVHSCAAYSSADTVLYSLGESGSDGAVPYAGLILDGAGNLFGTTAGGGASGYGTVFELTCTSYSSTAHSCESYSSTDSVLHSFTWSGGDGASPEASLILDGRGNLFGTTAAGGASPGCTEGQINSFSCGTVFKLACTTYSVSAQSCNAYSSADTVLLSFADGTGVGSPLASLILDGAGNLFGTSGYAEGATGAVFELACTSYDASNKSCATYTSADAQLYGFGGLSNGGNSAAGLILDGAGDLFGTTVVGGDETCLATSGCGTIFELACTSRSSSAETCTTYSASDAVYMFPASGIDGEFPYAGLILDGAGRLFGTTSYGGASGHGTIFEESGTELTPKYTLAASATSVTVAADGSLPVTLTLTSTNYTGTVQFLVTSNNSAVYGSVPSVSFASSTAVTTELTINTRTSAATHRSPAASRKSGGGLLFCVILLAVPFGARRKARWAGWFAALAISLPVFLTACGGGSSSSSVTTPQSPTYTLTVTPTGSGIIANAAGLSIQVTVD